MMTEAEIKERLLEAAYVMRLLPQVKAQGYVTVRFEIKYYPNELLMMDKKPIKLQATNEQIDRMDEAISWLDILEPFERKLVWKRAEKIPWKILCYEYALSRSQLNVKYDLYLSKIVGFLGKRMSRQKSTRQK
ncbi:MAG: DUF6362 family protein [Alphaproteobacteria bacterium]